MLKGMRLIWTILAIGCILSVPVQVMARGDRRGGEVEVDIISDQRGFLQKIDARFGKVDVERSYVIAREGERYRIRVTNRSNKRVGVVVAVDGRNIISGRKSYLESHERMYILGPYQTGEYEGWRTGRNRTNRFYFTGMGDSYAADWGDHTAMGVIAVAVFRERQQQFSRKGRRDKKSRKFQAMREAPGTGFGEQEWSPSREVHFVAQQGAIEKKFIKYEWRSTLCRLGIIQCRPDRPGRSQNRFWPHSGRTEGYAPYPSWFFQLRL